MNSALQLSLTLGDWFSLFLHYLSLSLFHFQYL